MLKNYIKNFLNKVGYNKLNLSHVGKISKDPLNANLHFKFALHSFKIKNYYLANAEFKTAEFLGEVEGDLEKYKKHVVSELPDPETMNHNQYFRFKTLADELNRRSGGGPYSVLDVGGGMGELASFIPDAGYCLAEPNINGISGTHLPFLDSSFDYVVSCHVLEHIPIENRRIFLDQLLSKCKRGLILLNPFHIDDTFQEERLKLVLEITGAEWAKEHLECTLPRIADIDSYAEENDLELSITPNGTFSTTLSFVFVDHFYSKSGLTKDWEQLNKFYNTVLDNKLLDSKDNPTAYLIYLGRKKPMI